MQEDWKNNFQIWFNNYKHESFMTFKDDDFDEIFNQIWFFKTEWISSNPPDELWELQIKWMSNFNYAWNEYDLYKNYDYEESDAFKLIWMNKKDWLIDIDEISVISDLIDIWDNILSLEQ